MTVMTPITTMPRVRAANCFKDSIGFGSCRRSGNTVTSAIWRKPPAVKGIIHDVLASIAVVAPEPPIATNAPKRPAPAVSNCAFAASHLLKPDLKRIAKSPTS